MDLVESELTEESHHGRHPWEQVREKVVSSLICSYTPSVLKENSSILDIGCGDTWLIEQLSLDLNNASFIAVDTAFTNELLAKYRKRLDPNKFEVFQAMDLAMQNRDEPVDLVLLLDVIEHIEDDISFLNWLLSFDKQITPQTKFLITVPAFQKLFSQHDVFLGHYRRYTNKMLRKHVEAGGLQVEKVGYFFFSLLPLRALVVLKEKLLGAKTQAKGVAAWKARTSDNVIKTILWLDYTIASYLNRLGIKLPGLSNYMVCKPKQRAS